MRKTTLHLAVITLILFAFTACEKSDDSLINHIEGTYLGTINIESGLKETNSVTVDVNKVSDELIKVHLYGSVLDTTLILNYYENNDSVNVCLSATEFEAEYGHTILNNSDLRYDYITDSTLLSLVSGGCCSMMDQDTIDHEDMIMDTTNLISNDSSDHSGMVMDTVELHDHDSTDNPGTMIMCNEPTAHHATMMCHDSTGKCIMMGNGHMDQDTIMDQGTLVGFDIRTASEWSKHLFFNHMKGDEHFGAFDMINQTFSFTIKKKGAYYKFKGKKK